ncbi:MAG: aminotransferase class V-fold PLP-dependent enzyme [Planctomycetes bacterium]|nr:aminotransferase class V-fold PLP-dependent enzyme [Planctomycetota bacterium]
MLDRRGFLGAITWPAAAATLPSCAWLKPGASLELAGLDGDARSPEVVARDEDFWASVQAAFTADRSMVNLNNGGVCPAPLVVQAAMKRYLDHANEAPAYVLWRLQDPQKETVRSGLARVFGCDPEEVAITRNASESLENIQQGFDLEHGDEVLTTDQDYPRMLTTWKQRERRDGIVLKQIQVPVPCEDDERIVKLFEEALTPRTKVLHICHVINLHGMVMPVRKLVQMARARGIRTVVDGAHSFAMLDFKRDDLDCDYFGTSLHKFLFAPHGTGLLYVRREQIKALWPLMAAGQTQDEDIRKFEEIGTHPLANRLAIAEALAFHERIGPARKAARQIYLRDYWAKRLLQNPRVKLHTSLAPGRSSGVALVEIEGVDSGKLNEHLWAKQRIFTVGIKHPQFEGLRISPTVYTRLSELDRFCEAMEKVARDGLPPA